MSEDSEYVFNINSLESYYICIKVIDNVGNINYLSKNISAGSLELTYTGDYQLFTVPYDGYYYIEVWGAQGGGTNSGLGGYTNGIIKLSKYEKLYVYVGSKGESNASVTNVGGYNGGGYSGNNSGVNSYGGGGATDIRYIDNVELDEDDLLWNSELGINSRIMVAAGGAGTTSTLTTIAGIGGGLIGGNGTSSDSRYNTSTYLPIGAIQNEISFAYSESKKGFFGYAVQTNVSGWGGGGGGGYYGGGMGHGTTGSGGSSFLSGYAGVNGIASSTDRTHTNNTLHYSGKYFINGKMQGGVNTGNGKAKITYLGNSEPERVNKVFNGVRYIKDCINGSSKNNNNHWVELQVIKNGINIAYDKKVSSTTSPLTGTNRMELTGLVDGIFNTSPYIDLTSGSQCVTVDLGDTYDLDEVAVWHYFNDGRTYNDNVTYVSSDNNNWKELIKTTEAETSNGKRVNVWNNTYIPSDNGYKKIILKYDNNGGSGCEYGTLTIGNPYGELCIPTRSGYHFAGWYTKLDGGSKITEDTIVRVTENQTLYAHWFEGNKPNIIFDVYGNDGYVSGNISNVINVYKGENDLDTSTFKYIWSTDVSAEPNISLVSGEEIILENASGIYYLIASVCDISGDCVKKVSNEFYVDNTNPEGTISLSVNSLTINVQTNISDSHSGINNYGYLLVNAGEECPTDGYITSTNSSYTYLTNTIGIHKVCVKAIDNAGNYSIISDSVEVQKAVYTYEQISANYSCANSSSGSSPIFTYTGDCSVHQDSNSNNWYIKLLSNGTLQVSEVVYVDIFLVGGGAGGSAGSYYIGGSGGGGGARQTFKNVKLSNVDDANSTLSYSITIGAGGGSNTAGGTTKFVLPTNILSASGGTVGAGGSGGGGGNDGGTSYNAVKGSDGSRSFDDTTTNDTNLYGAAGGGGGGVYNYLCRGNASGGVTGGGAGGTTQWFDDGCRGYTGSKGSDNLGAGGGGAGHTYPSSNNGGGQGGSGIVIIRNSQ